MVPVHGKKILRLPELLAEAHVRLERYVPVFLEDADTHCLAAGTVPEQLDDAIEISLARGVEDKELEDGIDVSDDLELLSQTTRFGTGPARLGQSLFIHVHMKLPIFLYLEEIPCRAGPHPLRSIAHVREETQVNTGEGFTFNEQGWEADALRVPAAGVGASNGRG
jgi:hypothetical protein